MVKQRTEVADIDRSLYDFRYDDNDAEKLDAGLTPTQRLFDAYLMP